jgi:hypothetical protein
LHADFRVPRRDRRLVVPHIVVPRGCHAFADSPGHFRQCKATAKACVLARAGMLSRWRHRVWGVRQVPRKHGTRRCDCLGQGIRLGTLPGVPIYRVSAGFARPALWSCGSSGHPL